MRPRVIAHGAGLLTFGILAAVTRMSSQQPAGIDYNKLDYGKNVQPIFTANCVGCHKGASAPAGLQLDSAVGVFQGSSSEKVIVPGSSKQSVLAQRISDTTGNQMPPGGPLSKDQIAIITSWIDEGAKADLGTGETRAATAIPPIQSYYPPAVTAVTSAAMERSYFESYCMTCHKGPSAPAGLQLDKLDTANVAKDTEKWEAVVWKTRAGMMPPAGVVRPDARTFEAMIAWMENELDHHAPGIVPPPGVHRLNRTEYSNAIRDLLALEIDPSKYLPSDDSTRGFDNVAAALTLSPALLEGYTSAAGKISRLAVGDVTSSTQAVFRVPEDTSQDYYIEGMPFKTRGGLLVKYEFPADGEYAIKVTPISKGNMGNTNPFGEIPNEKLEFLLDGQRIKLFDWDNERAREDGTLNVKFPAKAGLHTVVVTFLATNYAPGSDLDQHFLRSTIETGGLPGFKFFPHVGKIRIDGPFDAKGAGDTESRLKIFVCRPANASQEPACAKQIVDTLARHAYRRPATAQDSGILMSFYQQGRIEGGDFDHGIEMALRRVLVDPEFVFRVETPPAGVKPGEKYRISDLELASRLSFFLWSSIPDDELIDLASQNKLREPAMLDTQVKRMLADPRSNQLVINFAGQWLGLRALQTQIPATSLYPDFDDNLRQAMRTETEMFVNSVVHEDRSVLDLLDANYTFLNERLAKHYGIPGIYGSNFRRVELPPEFDMRRGLLGKGSLETISSAPDRTSPVGRGKAIMQIFLGVEPPPPPPDVKVDLKSDNIRGGGVPSMRQQMEMHRKNEPCATCHKIMDPIGFSMENFDAIGHWRTLDGDNPVDASGVLVDGTKLDGVKGMREALLRYSPQFVRVLTEKLMIYGLGRGTEYYDMPLMRVIVHAAERNQYKFSSFVLGVVESEPFQMNTKRQTTETARSN
jgi:cytochrome c5